MDAALLEDASDEATAAARGFATPSGGVGGTWYIIDVPGATTFSSAMTALQAINAAGRPARGNYVLFPATDQAIAQPERYTADPLLVSAGLASRQKSIDGVASEPTSSAVVQALAHDLPDLSTPYRLPASEANARRTAAEASQALAAHEVSNQFSVESSISAQTDWVLAMPTQRYSVALDYATGQRTFSVVPPAGEGRQYYHTDNTQARAGRVCRFNVNTTLHVSSREDLRDRVGTGALFPTPLSLQLCGAVTVAPAAQIASASPSVLSASAALSSPLQTQSAVTGWAALEFLDPTGQPVIGAAFMKLVNPGAAPGLAGHYGILYPHMVTQP
ncbi:surface layer protein NpdA [Paracidovorax anthurii]